MSASNKPNSETANTMPHSHNPHLLLLPDIGELFRWYPQCNAATMVEFLGQLGYSGQIAWLSDPDLDNPLYNALSAANYSVKLLAPDWSFATSEYQQLESFLNLYPQGRERLHKVNKAQAQLAEKLSRPLQLVDLWSDDLQQAVQGYHIFRAEQLDEGVGTLWRQRRLGELAQLLQTKNDYGVAVVSLDDFYDLQEMLGLPTTWPDWAADFQPAEKSRLRALADRAWRLAEEDDLNALLASLLGEEGNSITPKAELDTVAAGIYMAVGQLEPALELLERAAHALSDRQAPNLSGLTLARLGQVRDALGNRELAVRTYRAVQALSYAPEVAREVAERGLKQAFTLELEEAADVQATPQPPQNY